MPDTTLQTTPCFADLPEDVLVQIFQWLSAAALLAVERTRKSFRDVVRHHDYLFLKIYGEGPVHRRVHDDERDATTSRQLLREKYEWRQRLQTKDAVQMTPTDCIDTLLEKFYLCDDATLKGIAENVLFSLQEHRSDTVDYHEAAATALAVLGRKEEAAQNYDTILRRNETLPSRTILTAARFGWPCLPFLCFDADQFKGEALLGAAVGGQLSMLQELISIDAPLDYSSHGLSVALAAAMGGHTSILEYVQGAGVNLTSRASQNAETPLYYAAKYDNADAARYILAYTNEAEDILDAFDGGVISGSLSVLETLAPHLHHLEDALISRFLKTACCSTTTVALHFLLVDQKMDANHLLEDGSCAVHLVAKENKLEHLTVLLECGASILPMDATGQTALEIALSLNHTELIEFLVQVSPEYGRNGFTHQEKLKYVEDCLDRLRPLYLGVIVMGHRSGSNEGGTKTLSTESLSKAWDEGALVKLSRLWMTSLSTASLAYFLEVVLESRLVDPYFALISASASAFSNCPHVRLQNRQSGLRTVVKEILSCLSPNYEYLSACCLGAIVEEAVSSIAGDDIRSLHAVLTTEEGRRLSTGLHTKAHEEMSILRRLRTLANQQG